MATPILAPGTLLGRYRLVEQIGAGGMGRVFRAHDERLDRDVALKVLSPGTLGDEAARKRFRKEALTLSKLNHPNIETVFDFDTQEGIDFLVMEFISGTPLDHKLAAKAIPENQVIALGVQLAQGLEAAHEQGVIHRDLKPGNLCLTGDGRLKVLDFGLAKLLHPGGDAFATESLSQAEGIAGTVPYMAPEQLRGGKVDARSDIYAAGAVLYEMATGRRPFLGHGATLVDEILNHEPPTPRAVNPQISPELEGIILKALAKDPDARYFSARELLVNLQRLERSSAANLVLTQRREPPRIAAAVVGIALLALVAVVAMNVGGVRDRIFRRGAPAAGAAKPSVAVLLFRNLSADTGNQYFSDGMTEEITSKLSRISSMNVASESSVLRFKDSPKDVKQIGAELGVRYVVEGSVRKAGDRVRITAELIDTSTGFNLWSDEFDGELKDVFGVQDQTALKIVDALNVRLSPQEQQAVRRRYTDNPAAYDAYLRGREEIRHWDSPEHIEAARKAFESALALDPNYAPALAGLAQVETDYYRDIDAGPAHLVRARELAQKAITLDPQLAEAHNAMGNVYADDYDYRTAAGEFRRATQAAPDDPSTWGQLAWVLNYVQPPEAKEAEQAARRAIALQATGGTYLEGAYYQLGRALMWQERYEESIGAFEHALAIDPKFRSPHLGLGQVYLAQGKYDEALAELRKAGDHPVAVVQVASLYAARNQRDQAFAELEKALARGYRDFAYLDASPYLASLRSDPRYAALMSRYRK